MIPGAKTVGQVFQGIKQSLVTTASSVKNPFPQIRRGLSSLLDVHPATVTEEMDKTQVGLLKELCILVDSKDKPIKAETKENCHLMKNINQGMLHRAFSVFLFNTKGELLLQQRSDAKITFPGYFTNTCCSHPLYTKEELEESNALGIKRAAQRRLFQELGIRKDEIPLEDFHFLTRIHYMAPYDDKWGEHEIDYVLFIQKDVKLNPNDNEVKTCIYVNKKKMREYLAALDVPLTPWFQLILDKFLFQWWDKLASLNEIENSDVIHHLI